MMNDVVQPANAFDIPCSHAMRATIRLNPAGGTIHLMETQLMILHDAAGWTVETLCGTVWITQQDDRRDIVLGAGESFALDRDGKALLWSHDQTRVRLLYTAPRGKRKCTAR